MGKTALLVIDVQNALVKEHPYQEDSMIHSLEQLISSCRDKEIEVIYVQHNGEEEENLAPGTEGWQIYDKIKPTGTERVFNKDYNSAFKGTGLQDYLDTKEYATLIIAGMQTEYCIDTSIKVAFENGFDLIIAEDAISTFDQPSISAKEIREFYFYRIWNNRFGKVLESKEIIKNL
ncbi:isochorismatase family protein [Anaerocolumna sedimenticola]|uniref:Isochorismatase family protein n=1 Tax=Anaerocolumna sedimenticola TaxID=2696063 RepID=A0A6P1TQ14_9FIRM|nr:cysteine hydrolase family protein [Anaerocolumna sedimenticola]QHQ61695.1 isochorismatase family protein [Anaerocolumna sedimenticola]